MWSVSTFRRQKIAEWRRLQGYWNGAVRKKGEKPVEGSAPDAK